METSSAGPVVVRRPGRGGGLALALLATTQFLLILDAGIVNVALPSIARDLGFAPADLSWVVNAYVLAFGGFLLLGGRLADLVGRRRLFSLGVALFAAASLAGALAPAAVWLVAARAVQGLGAALVAPAALSLLMTIFVEGPARARALALFGAMAGLGGASGGVLGGVLTELVGWPAVLWINVPIGAGMIALAPRLLPAGLGRWAGAGQFDLAGAVLVTAGLGTLVYSLVQAAEAGWASLRTVGLVTLAVALLTGFVAVEARVSNPLVPLAVFRLRLLRSANLVMLFLTMATMSMFFLVTLYLQEVYEWGPIATGLGFVPIVGTMVLFHRLAPWVVARLGLRGTLGSGLLATGLGLAWLSRLSGPGGHYLVEVAAPGVVLGTGFGVAYVAAMVAATTGAPAHQSGLASGLVNTSQQVGTALGLAVLVSLAAAQTAAVRGAGEALAVAQTAGLGRGLLVGAGFALAGAACAALLVPSGRRSSPAAGVPAGPG